MERREEKENEKDGVGDVGDVGEIEDSILESALEDFEEEETNSKGKKEMKGGDEDALEQLIDGLSRAHGDEEMLKDSIDEVMKSFDFDENVLNEFMNNPEMLPFLGDKGDADKNSEVMLTDLMNACQDLLSKDMLYEPLKELNERYPGWLESNRDHLSQEDLSTYSKQMKVIQSLLNVYDEDPENIDRIVELIQQVQDTGQPPAEIMNELAPELQSAQDQGQGNLQLPSGEACNLL